MDETPEFEAPKEIPIPLPDLSHPLPSKHACQGVTKAGIACRFPKRKDSGYCTVHDPSITEATRQEWRKKGHANHGETIRVFGPKKKHDLLLLMSKRIDAFTDMVGDMSTPEIEKTFCHLAKTYCELLIAEGAKEDEVPRGWRMKGSG